MNFRKSSHKLWMFHLLRIQSSDIIPCNHSCNNTGMSQKPESSATHVWEAQILQMLGYSANWATAALFHILSNPLFTIRLIIWHIAIGRTEMTIN